MMRKVYRGWSWAEVKRDHGNTQLAYFRPQVDKVMDSTAQIPADFDPDGVGAKGALFGLPFNPEQAQLVIIPVPWEVTVSYAAGTARGPQAILNASSQVDLFMGDIPDAWKYGVTMLPIPDDLAALSDALRSNAEDYIGQLEEGTLNEQSPEAQRTLSTIDEGCARMVAWVKNTAAEWRAKGKQVALVGGDHSTPLGLITDLATSHDGFGILQIDAHADLRPAYEGFTSSHASIMFNALRIEQVEKLVQVGIRDYCEQEAKLAADDSRISTHYYNEIARRRFRGESWHAVCESIVAECPQKVYISFDIDGLDPKLCPNTGTPVPGGFEFEEVNYLLTRLVASGRTIIGFDLNEVSPGSEPDALEVNDWDGNVGARMLYRLCALMAASQGELTLADR